MNAIAKNIPLASHIISRRDGYNHHGIYVGEGQVIHYSGFNQWGDTQGIIEQVSLATFQNDGGEIEIYAVPDATTFPPNHIIQRAKSRIGEKNYSLLTNNCEHFANWCMNGKEDSSQVQKAIIFSAFAVGRMLYTALKK